MESFKKMVTSSIAMILKCNNPQSLLEYKPISHIGSIHKFISKLWALRLKTVLPQCVSNSQTPSYL